MVTRDDGRCSIERFPSSTGVGGIPKSSSLPSFMNPG